jgi:hypothetical protein
MFPYFFRNWRHFHTGLFSPQVKTFTTIKKFVHLLATNLQSSGGLSGELHAVERVFSVCPNPLFATKLQSRVPSYHI